MDVYLDLSMVFLLIQIMVCIYGSELLMVYRYKRGLKITLILVNTCLFFTIYLHFIFSLLIFIIVNLFIFVAFNKKWLYSYLIFNLLFFLIDFFVILITDNIKLINIYLVINKPIGVLYSLFVPFFGLCLLLATKFVDSVFHLHVYKTTCFISKDDKKYSFSAYFDNGNTLKYNNVPVIFCLKKIWMFDLSSPQEIEVETVNGIEINIGYNALISVEDKDEEFFVYVVLVDDINSFHGCEILLNAYLR